MCCLFGIIDYGKTLSARQRTAMLSILATECEVRGTDATGIAYNGYRKMRIYKRPKAAHEMRFLLPQDANVIMGHTRMATQGKASRNLNNHPFAGRADHQPFALAHNGVLYNDTILRTVQHLPKTRIQTDSFIAVQLIEQKRTLNFDSLRSMAEQVEGSFSFTVLDNRNNLYFVRGENPLCIYHYPRTGLYLYASTEEILRKAVQKVRILREKPVPVKITCGDILCIESNGQISSSRFNTDHLYANWCFTGRQFGYPSLYSYALDDSTDETYVEELKSVAAAFGYAPDDITTLCKQGFSPEEIEEWLYCGEI